jgi:hypothetical protein
MYRGATSATVLYHGGCMPQDLASIRLANALRLFDEFVQATVKHPDAATLRGLERRFAERLGIQPSYWSQIKARGRQIGERLARQFETACHKPAGWMDQPPGASAAARPAAAPAPAAREAGSGESLPRDDDERFIVGLVLSYYRRHPQRARTRLLDLLGEVLGTPPAPAAPPATVTAKPAVDDRSAWAGAQRGIQPLKRKR